MEKISPLMEVKLPVCAPLNPPGGRVLNCQRWGLNQMQNILDLLANPKSSRIVCHLKRTIQPNTFAGRTKEKQASPITVVLLQQYLRNWGKTEENTERKEVKMSASPENSPFPSVNLHPRDALILGAATALLRP